MANSKVNIESLIVNRKIINSSIDSSGNISTEKQKRVDDIRSDNFKIQSDDGQKSILNEYEFIESQVNIQEISKSLKNNSYSIPETNNSELENIVAPDDLFKSREKYGKVFDNQFSSYLKDCDEYESLKESFIDVVADESQFAELMIDYLKQGQSTRFSTKHQRYRDLKSLLSSYISKANRTKLDQIRNRICYFAIYNHARNNHSLSAHKLLTDAQTFLLIMGSIFIVIILAQFKGFYGYIAVMISLFFFMLTNIVKLTSIVGYALNARGDKDKQIIFINYRY